MLAEPVVRPEKIAIIYDGTGASYLLLAGRAKEIIQGSCK